MDTKELELYESPTSEVVELKTEGMICESGGGMPNGIDPEIF